MESPRAKRQTQGETDRKPARRGRAQESDGVEASVAVKLVSTVLREQHCDRERKPQPSMDQIQRSAWNSALGLELLVAVRCALSPLRRNGPHKSSRRLNSPRPPARTREKHAKCRIRKLYGRSYLATTL